MTTYDNYRHLPDDGKQYEIIHGELYMTPVPNTFHQRILLNLIRTLDPFVNENNLGEILIAPVDVVLSMTDVVQSDLVFVARERLNIITKKNIVEAPNLVLEIISENIETIYRQKKMELYEKHGVGEYWIVDPDAKTIEQFIQKKEKFKLQTKTEGQ